LQNRKVQNIVAAVLILLALLALLFQGQLWEWWQRFSLRYDKRPAIAEIVSLNKNVRFRLPESLTYYKAYADQPLHAKDTVSTDPDSSAIITFKSGLKVELEPNSLIIIEDYGSGPGALELTFLRGGVKILSEGNGPKVKLKGTDVVKLDLSGLDRVKPTPPLTGIGLDDKKERRKQRKKKEEKETLSDSYIASVIRNQKTFLNRCYAQHLRLNPDARGRIDTSLTIEADGTISTARVIGSTIPDPSLQQCVVTTLQRARFRSFRGDPIIVNYPINFE
jgi:hypothetical protein